MDVRRLLTLGSGFTTRETLRAHGASDRQIRWMLAEGRLVAIGRSILASPGADPELSRAVAAHARLACVSAARRMGLWVLEPEDSAVHVTPRTHNSHFRRSEERPAFVVHWSMHPIEPDSARIAIESGRNALMHVAHCQRLDAAVATFDSAVRQGLISVDELRALAAVHGGRLALVVEHVSALADSGLESVTRVRLRLAGIGCREQVVIDGHPVDLLAGERLVIQLDGDQHRADRVQHARDRAQDRRLQRMGYTVLRFGYAEVVHAWQGVLAEITAHLALEARVAL